MPPIRIAIIGAGLFARDAHIPTIQQLSEHFQIVAVASRRIASAQELAKTIGDVWATDDINAIFADDTIDAVDIILPIAQMPAIVDKALRANKHVLSEKPIAPTVAIGKQLLAARGKQVWMVGENWRYESRIVRAAEIIASGRLGAILTAHWTIHTPMNPSNAYYHTDWRRNNSFPGGYLLDGGVHHIAALRMLLGEMASVSAVITQHRADLPPSDTLSASIHYESGAIGAYLVTYASGAPWGNALHILGTEGAIIIEPKMLHIINGEHRESLAYEYDGIYNELLAFARAIRDQTPHRNSAEEALRDVACIEAMLRSAESGQRVYLGDIWREK